MIINRENKNKITEYVGTILLMIIGFENVLQCVEANFEKPKMWKEKNICCRPMMCDQLK